MPFWRVMSYSQNNEEEIVASLFPDLNDGRFLDIGAFNGKTFSNTYRLWERGWSGVAVEPSPNCCDAMLKLYKDDTRVTISNVAVVPDNPGWRSFHDSGGDAISSLDKGHADKWTAGYSGTHFKTYDLFAVTMEQIFERYGCAFNMISLDVESTNKVLFEKIPFGAISKCKCIVVEHDGHADWMKDHVSGHGFKERARNGENIILYR